MRNRRGVPWQDVPPWLLSLAAYIRDGHAHFPAAIVYANFFALGLCDNRLLRYCHGSFAELFPNGSRLLLCDAERV